MRIGILGTSGALVSADRDNTFFCIDIDQKCLLVDCAGNPVGKMLQLGFDPLKLDTVFLTHLHVDHCYGIPSLLFHLFLLNRTEPLSIFVPDGEWSVLREQLASHQLFPDARSFRVELIGVPAIPFHIAHETDLLTVKSIPTDHNRESRAYRIDEIHSRTSVAISGDTRPIEMMADLARGTDILIHESSFLDEQAELADVYGHSTALQAGRIAQSARARNLYLVHFDFKKYSDTGPFKTEAESVFTGPVTIPRDMDSIKF